MINGNITFLFLMLIGNEAISSITASINMYVWTVPTLGKDRVDWTGLMADSISC